MTLASPLVEGLRRWERLWEHPHLFRLLTGADPGLPKAQELMDALMASEVADPREALSFICGSHDLAAADAACQCLSPLVGVPIAEQAYAAAQKDFDRRKAQVIARARPLSSRALIEASLAAAEASLPSDPASAERELRKAFEATEIAERNDLAALDRTYQEPKVASLRWKRFQAAIREGNLRLAHIYATHLDDPASSATAEAWEDWTGLQDVRRAIGWLLDPATAPAWLPRAELEPDDLLLLSNMAYALDLGSIDEAIAGSLIRIMFTFLGAEEAASNSLSPATHAAGSAGADQDWSEWRLTPQLVELLVPHLAGSDDVTMLVPHIPAVALGESLTGASVALDLFGTLRDERSADLLTITPRMLLQLIPARGDRREQLVRLVSRSVSLPVLIEGIVENRESRAQLMAGDDPRSSPPVDRGFVDRLAKGLDIYVDEGDVDVLHDASGANLRLLLEILTLLCQELASPRPDERRWDVLAFVLSPRGEAAVEQLVKDSFESQCGRPWEDLARIAKDIWFELELHESSRQPATISALARSMVEDEIVSDIPGAEEWLRILLALGVLEEVKIDPAREPRLGTARSLPSRMLLRGTLS